MYSPLFVCVGVLLLSLLWHAFSCVFSRLGIILKREIFIGSPMSCYCKYSVALPHGAIGWSAVCDRDIF